MKDEIKPITVASEELFKLCQIPMRSRATAKISLENLQWGLNTSRPSAVLQKTNQQTEMIVQYYRGSSKFSSTSLMKKPHMSMYKLL